MDDFITLLSTQIAFISFFIITIVLYYFYKVKENNSYRSYEEDILTRNINNPVISPRQNLQWEKEGTFNPAVVEINNKVHLLYRAVGSDGVSRIGYASSEDGLNFGQGDIHPIFSFERSKALNNNEVRKYDPVMYPSGGSSGGCEDPRITKIGDTLYMTFSAFGDWDFIRVGLSMINEKDFIKKKWSSWSKPILISPPNEIHKNWVIFPEKINGKFAILHSVSPKIEIEFRENLNTIGSQDPYIKSPAGIRLDGDRKSWDKRIRGAGPPPLKTEKGWLVLYHANDSNEPYKYKLGAQLLDLYNPTKVIAKASLPILEPTEWYENDGKPGVVYVCGAIIKENSKEGDSLYVYYGGGDKYVCVAHTHLDTLLTWLINNGEVRD